MPGVRPCALPGWARVPVRRALGVCSAGSGGQGRGPPAGRDLWQRRGRCRDGRGIFGRARESTAREAARDEEEDDTTSGVFGHAAGTRAGGASTPWGQKRLRLRKNNWHSTIPAERGNLLPSLYVDCNPAQQAKEEEEDDERNGGAQIRSISLNGMQQPLNARVGGSTTKLGEQEQGEEGEPSGEASSIGRGNPIEAPSIWGRLVASRGGAWGGSWPVLGFSYGRSSVSLRRGATAWFSAFSARQRDGVVRWRHPVTFLVVDAEARFRTAIDRAFVQLEQALDGVQGALDISDEAVAAVAVSELRNPTIS